MSDTCHKKPDASDRETSSVCPMCSVRVLRSEDLLRGGREVLILHEGEVYRLLRTRNNKLILQK